MGGGVEKERNLQSDKQAAINEAIQETRGELSGFEKFVNTVKEFIENPQEALSNLWKEITGQPTEAQNTETVESQVNTNPAVEYFSNISHEGIDIPQDTLFNYFLEYMQHQQGAGGALAIVQNITFNRPLPANILSNMKNNVYKDFPGGKKNVNGGTFVRYRYKKFLDNYREFAHKTLPYEDAIDEIAASFGQPKEIIKTIIGIESKGDRYANKGKSSVYKGLMQVDIRQIEKYGVTDIYDPKQNMMMAMKLRQENAPQLKKLTSETPTLIAKMITSPERANVA